MLLLRTNSENPHFIELVRALDAELAIIDGEDHAFYSTYNKIQSLQHVVVLFIENKPVACGAIKPFDDTSAEVKRMYTLPEFRGKGVATLVLHELEKWAAELGYIECVLETGKRQPDAIQLYKKNGYTETANYGQYVGVENSVCFSKNLHGHKSFGT
jgi:putative acetyltransferase